MQFLRFLVLGTSKFTLECADSLLEAGCIITGIVTLTNNLLPDCSISFDDYCFEKKIPLIVLEDINNETSITKIKQFDSDYILSSWPKILSDSVLSIPKYFTIGSHPTSLPMCRGRHPLHWLICLGIPNTHITFFRMDNGIDTGSILCQEIFPLGDSIHDANLYMSIAAKNAILNLVAQLIACPNYGGIKQDKRYSNYLRKRDIHDVTLDPRMSASMALRIINSFSPPYPGAVLMISKDLYLRVSSGLVVSVADKFPNWRSYEHGYIFYRSENEVTLRFDDSVLSLKLISSDRIDLCKLDKKIHPPSYYFD